MEFTNFATLIKNEVEKKAGNQYHVRLNDVKKNNGVVLRGITLMQDDSNISPTIYLNTYYDAYENGQTTIGTVIDSVLDTYEKNKINRSVDMNFFMNYEKIKGRIIYKLINTEKNQEMLEDIPHIPFHNLSIVFQCLVSEEMFGNATIMIHNAHMRIWKVNAKELYDQAMLNTPRLQGYVIQDMKTVLKEMMALEDNCGEIEENLQGDVPMYVLSNRTRINGAACILYPDILKDFAEAMGTDVYILPSSVHEVILLPTEGMQDCRQLKEMVKEINGTQVQEEEVLSDSVYFYHKKTGKLYTL